MAPRLAKLGETGVRRRDLLKAAAAATFTLSAAPRLGRADRAKTLVFVGVADLSVLDPVVTGARPTRNYAYLVFDARRSSMVGFVTCACRRLHIGGDVHRLDFGERADGVLLG